LPEAKWVLGGPTFALGGRHLYFLAGAPEPFAHNNNLLANPFTMVALNLCRVETAHGAKVEVIAKSETFQSTPKSYGSEVTLASHGDEVFAGYTSSSVGQGTYAVLKIEADGKLTPLFEAATKGGRLSVDEDGHFFIGGNKQVNKYTRAGQPAPNFTSWAIPSLGPVPTEYIGAVMLTRNSVWDFGHYGFVGRYTREGKPQPGALTQWAHLLSWIGQIAEAPDGNFYLKSNEALYLAKVEDDKIKLLQRFGALPEVNALMLSSNGYIATGNDLHSGLLWFDFDAKSGAAAPLRGDWPGPLAQGYIEGEAAFTYAMHPGWIVRGYTPKPKGIVLRRYIATPSGGERNYDEGQARGEFEGDIISVAKAGDFVFAIDREKNQLVRGAASKPGNLSPLQNAPDFGADKLNSLATVGANTLLSCAGNTLSAWEANVDGSVKPLWKMQNFGEGAEQKFGNILHVSASGNRILIADSQRHRALLFALGEDIARAPQLVAQFGQTDKTGDGVTHLNAPTFVALNGSRAAIYDSINHRIVKLRLAS
jgi:hypothetical protein